MWEKEEINRSTRWKRDGARRRGGRRERRRGTEKERNRGVDGRPASLRLSTANPNPWPLMVYKQTVTG